MYQLKVGASKKSISPLADMFPLRQQWMNGKGFYTGVHKDINVRTIALDNGDRTIVFVVQEIPDPMNGEELKAAILEKYGIAPENVFYATTHDHCCSFPARLSEEGSPDTKFEENDFRFARHILDQSVIAVGEAIRNMRPAKYGYGTTNSYINVSREELEPNEQFYIFGKNFEMPSDKTLAAIKFEDYEGHLIATILNYACHSTVCFRVKDEDGGIKIYGDLAGEISDFVERVYEEDGAVAMWTMSAAADQTSILTLFNEYLPDMSFEPAERYDKFLPTFHWKLCEHLGQRQGLDAVKLLRSIKRMRTSMKFSTCERVLSFPVEVLDGYDGLDERTNDPKNFKLVEIPGKTTDIHTKLLLLGDMAFFGMNIETPSLMGTRLKEESPFKKLFVVTMWDSRCSMSGYVVDKKGYEMKTSIYYRNMIKGGVAEDALAEAMLEMYDELLNA